LQIKRELKEMCGIFLVLNCNEGIFLCAMEQLQFFVIKYSCLAYKLNVQRMQLFNCSSRDFSRFYFEHLWPTKTQFQDQRQKLFSFGECKLLENIIKWISFSLACDCFFSNNLSQSPRLCLLKRFIFKYYISIVWSWLYMYVHWYHKSWKF
jgi:hypothetical protein